MTRWVAVGRAADLKFTPGAPVKVDGRWLALFPFEGSYVALDNPCPHAGAPLCDGSMIDGKVVCFLHCWGFDLRTGACDVGKEWSVATYPVRLVDGVLEVLVESNRTA